jgi:hypothetical protein
MTFAAGWHHYNDLKFGDSVSVVFGQRPTPRTQCPSGTRVAGPLPRQVAPLPGRVILGKPHRLIETSRRSISQEYKEEWNNFSG